MTFKLAACIVIRLRSNVVFAVTRKSDLTKFGFPGGKQDPQESNLDCAVREVKEETGLSLNKDELVPLYSGACFGADGQDFWVTTYLLDATQSSALDDQDVKPEEGLLIKLVNIETLCHVEYSPFHYYNRAVADALHAYDQDARV